MSSKRRIRVVGSLMYLSLVLFLTYSKPARLWGNKNVISHGKATAGGLPADVQSGSPRLENFINLAGLKHEGPDWRILSQDIGSDKGHIKLSQSKWLMYFLHWRPLTEANKTITVEYVRNHLLNFWGQAMNFKLLNVDGEMEICGHRAVFTEGILTSGAVHTRFIVWNCPQTSRQFTADCNINLQRKTPEDLLDLQRTITQTVCCHKDALPPEVPADLTQKYQSDRWNVSFYIPSTWQTADYVSEEWFPQGISAQNGSLWTLLTDSVKRLELVWENCKGPLSTEVFTRFMEKCTVSFTVENVTSHLDKWDLGDIREVGGVWTGEGTCEYLLKVQNQEAVSRYRSKGFLWKDGPKAYFLLASLIQVREFWNIPNDVSPSDETFERFVAKQIFPNVKIVPITAFKENFVIIGAHYDHLSPIKADDIEVIIYRADDNANLSAISDEKRGDLGITFDKLDEEYSVSFDHTIFFEKTLPSFFTMTAVEILPIPPRIPGINYPWKKIENTARLCLLTAWEIAERERFEPEMTVVRVKNYPREMNYQRNVPRKNSCLNR